VEEKFILITNPANQKLINQSFLAALSEDFGHEFTFNNTILYTNLVFNEDRVHLFQNDQYRGYLLVVPEDGNARIRNEH
jgi:hypothetical protein